MRIIDVADGNERGQCFFTYNHDLEHPYFAPRPEFVRGSVKYQGMVGVVGDGGKTRLTWLVNVDWGGLIPTSFLDEVLVGLMSFPLTTVMDLHDKKQNSGQRGDEAAVIKSPAVEDLSHKSIPGESLEEVQEKLKVAEARADSLQEKLNVALSKAKKAESELSVLRRRLKHLPDDKSFADG